MKALPSIAIGVFLIAHALVHAVYFIRPDDPDFPMTADRSWLVGRLGLGVVRPLVAVLAIGSLVCFVLLALSFWELLVPAAWFTPLGVVAATLSLVLIVVTWDKTFVVGAAIDVGILVWVLR